MHAISDRNFRDLQAVLTWVAHLRDCTDPKDLRSANTIRKAKLLLRAFSRNEKMAKNDGKV
mgnify:CR=1 FL=1